MKTLLIILGLMTSVSINANAADKCLNILTAKLKLDAKKSSDWGFESLSVLKKTDAASVIENALAEDEEEDKQKMLSLVDDKNILFYVLSWNAPSNSGTTAIAVDQRTCKEVVDVLLGSEE